MLNSIKSPIIKLYRWTRFRHGHGVHSPFAFSLINDVIEEKNSYYAYRKVIDQIERVKNRRLYQPDAPLEYLRLLFRISNYFRPQNIIQLGCNSGDALLYLQSPSQSIRCYLIESDNQKTESALLLAGNNSQIRIINPTENELSETFEKTLLANKHTGIIIFHDSISTKIKQITLEMCLNNQKERTILIIEGINNSEDISLFWKHVIKDKRIAVSFNLISFGIIVIDSHLHKRNYKLFF